jgi:TIR domain
MKVFISHAQSDRGFARRLAGKLEGAGHQVWADWNVLPGDNWASLAGGAIGKADALIALVSPDALRSDFVKREWEYALGQERFRDSLIPVQLKHTPAKPWIFDRLHPVSGTTPEAVGRAVLARLGARPNPVRARVRASS